MVGREHSSGVGSAGRQIAHDMKREHMCSTFQQLGLVHQAVGSADISSTEYLEEVGDHKNALAVAKPLKKSPPHYRRLARTSQLQCKGVAGHSRRARQRGCSQVLPPRYRSAGQPPLAQHLIRGIILTAAPSPWEPQPGS